MIFRSYILKQSKTLLLLTAFLLQINLLFAHEIVPEQPGNSRRAEISAQESLLTLPAETSSLRTEKPHTASFERIDKAEQINCLFVKNQLKVITSKEDRYDGVVRLQFFLITQFSTST